MLKAASLQSHLAQTVSQLSPLIQQTDFRIRNSTEQLAGDSLLSHRAWICGEHGCVGSTCPLTSLSTGCLSCSLFI